MNPVSLSPLHPIESGHVAGDAQGMLRQGEPEVAMKEISHDQPGGGVEAAEEDDQEGLGERIPKVGRRPDIPTRKEIEEHFPLHVHYRAWCPHCVAGRSTSRQHRCQEDEEVLGPCVSLDYAFKYGDEKEEATSPVLVAVDKGTGAIMGSGGRQQRRRFGDRDQVVG